MLKGIVIGNLGSAPEARYVSSGDMVTSFSVASTYKEQTTWVRCNAWGRLATLCNDHLDKGTKVYLEGHLSTKTYDRRDGTQGFSLEMRVTDVQFLGRSNGNAPASQPQENFQDVDDLPF